MLDTESYHPGFHKLIHHLDHLKKIKNQDIVGPIHLSVFPTNFCQLNCEYCCFKKTERTNEELSLDDFKVAIDILTDYGLKAVEESGGGDPLLWSSFIPATEYAYNKGLKLSLVTNGLALETIPQNILGLFRWIRVSIQSTEYAKKINMNWIPDNVKKSMSYIVYDDKSYRELTPLNKFAKENNIIIRIAPVRPCNYDLDESVAFRVATFGKPFLYFPKEIGEPEGCYMLWIRAALDWNGNFLPCPSIELSPEHAGKIPDDFGVCKAKDIKYWLYKNRPHDLGYRCSFCNCGLDSNNLIFNLMNRPEDVDFV